MSIISALRTFIATCPSLETGKLLLVDQLGSTPVQYSIIPFPGARIIESYLNGGSLRDFPFALQSMKSTADDLERIENIGFYEEFADWLEEQTEVGNLPSLGVGKTSISIQATSWGFLYQAGESSTGIYQIVCSLIYEQER